MFKITGASETNSLVCPMVTITGRDMLVIQEPGTHLGCTGIAWPLVQHIEVYLIFVRNVVGHDLEVEINLIVKLLILDGY
jgi:hypothetical protein